VYLLPGVPREVRHLIEKVIEPRIARGAPSVLRKTIKVIGYGESRLEHTVRAIVKSHKDRVRFGYRALGVENHIKLAAKGEGRVEAVAAAEADLREALGPAIFGSDSDTLLEVLKAQLIESGATVATAESCTGGLVAKMLTDLAGSSAYFLGGFVTYSNDAKTALLGVSSETLETHGAVSEQVVREMAEGARARVGADYALAASGIAGPGGGTDDKPVGTVYVAWAGPKTTEARRLSLPGDRAMIRSNTATILLDALRRELLAK
jgi:nicotinamide-nucleotide amidase